MGESPKPTGEHGPIVTGYAGGDTRFQMLARVQSLSRRHAIVLKADVPDDDLTVDSWLPVYAGANWHEREAQEMFGIAFVGHPEPRRALPADRVRGPPAAQGLPAARPRW